MAPRVPRMPLMSDRTCLVCGRPVRHGDPDRFCSAGCAADAGRTPTESTDRRTPPNPRPPWDRGSSGPSGG